MYSRVSNKRVGWNKRAGWKKSPNLRNFGDLKLFKNKYRQNLRVRYDNKGQRHYISIKWQWKRPQNPKI